METTRKLTLPSGATCKVRRLTAQDSLALGFFPDTLADDSKSQPSAAKKNESQRIGVAMSEIVLCDCTGKITRPDGTFYKITRKPWDPDSESDDLNAHLAATTEDGAFIVSQVLEMSGFSVAAKEAARPFPEESGVDGESGRDVQALQVLAK